MTDGRFSGGTSGLSIGHVSPEAAAGGAIALVEEGDTIEIDIPRRLIQVAVSDSVLGARRVRTDAVGGWKPVARIGWCRRRSRPMRRSRRVLREARSGM